MTQPRRPAGTPAGGQFSTDLRGRSGLRLPSRRSDAQLRAEAEERYLRLVDSYRERDRQVRELPAGAPISQRLAAAEAAWGTWREMDTAAAALGITPPYRRPVEPPELAAARQALTELRDAAEARSGGQARAWAAVSGLASGDGAISEEEFGERWGEIRDTYWAAEQLEEDPDTAERWLNQDDARLALVNVEDHAVDGGYDFAAMNDELAVAWARRRSELVTRLFDEQWAARSRPGSESVGGEAGWGARRS